MFSDGLVGLVGLVDLVGLVGLVGLESFDDSEKFNDSQVSDGPKVMSNESMDFNDPKEFDDILVSPDPRGISIGSMDFDNPKVDVDKFILDGLDYVARPGSASLKIVKITRRGTRKLLKSLYYRILCDCLLQVMQSA